MPNCLYEIQRERCVRIDTEQGTNGLQDVLEVSQLNTGWFTTGNENEDVCNDTLYLSYEIGVGTVNSRLELLRVRAQRINRLI